MDTDERIYATMKASIEADITKTEQALNAINNVWIENNSALIYDAIKSLGAVLAVLKRKLVEVELVNPNNKR